MAAFPRGIAMDNEKNDVMLQASDERQHRKKQRKKIFYSLKKRAGCLLIRLK